MKGTGELIYAKELVAYVEVVFMWESRLFGTDPDAGKDWQ